MGPGFEIIPVGKYEKQVKLIDSKFLKKSKEKILK